MEETENQGSVQLEQEGIAAPEVDSGQETIVSAQDQIKEETQEKDWVKRLRRDRDEALRKVKMYEEYNQHLLSQPRAPVQAVQPPQEDILAEIAKEDYVPGEKVVKALQRQQADFDKKFEALKQDAFAVKKSTVANELRKEYDDFDSIVNPDSLAILDEMYRPRAEAISQIKDPYAALLLAYDTIKSLGIQDQLQPSKRSKEVQKKLEQNKKTVASPQSYSARPIAQAFKEPTTKEEKSALWNETLKYASVVGGGY